MKTTWVLTEEERMLMFVRKGNKRKDRVSVGGSVNVSESSSVPPGQMPVLRLLRLTSTISSSQSYVAAAGVYEQSRVADMDTQLTRKIIRMITFKVTLDQYDQSQLRGVISSPSLKFVTIIEVSVVVTKD